MKPSEILVAVLIIIAVCICSYASLTEEYKNRELSIEKYSFPENEFKSIEEIELKHVELIPVYKKTQKTINTSFISYSEPKFQRIPLETGKVSWFGGPHDEMEFGRGTALGYGKAQNLDPNTFYCAFRYPVRLSKDILRAGYIEFKNPYTGKRARAKIVDWGPAEWTGRTYDLSKGLLDYLDLITDDNVQATLYLPLS